MRRIMLCVLQDSCVCAVWAACAVCEVCNVRNTCNICTVCTMRTMCTVCNICNLRRPFPWRHELAHSVGHAPVLATRRATRGECARPQEQLHKEGGQPPERAFPCGLVPRVRAE